MPRLIFQLAFLLTAHAAPGEPLPETKTPLLPDECQNAASVVSSGAPASKLISSYDRLGACTVGYRVPALVTAWGRSASTTAELGWREKITASVSDGRLLSAVATVARQSNRSQQERMSALSMLTHLMRPGRFLHPSFWYHSDTMALSVASDIDVDPGTQPISSSDRAAALSQLDAMATSDPDPSARKVAQRLSQLLR